MIESGNEPEFSHLTEFVERRAIVANTAFGKLVGTKPDGEKGPKPDKLRMAGDQAVKATTLATQVSHSHQKQDRLRAPGQASGAVTQASTSVAPPSTCLFCDSSHALGKCFRFNKRLCMNFLREGHIARQCRGARACMFSGCSRRHHSLLHPPPNQEETSTRVVDRDAQILAHQSPSNAFGAGEEGQCTTIGSSSPRVGLRIVPVKVRGCDGRTELETYAFLDNGSDTTLCLNGLAQRLGLNVTLKHFSLSSVNSENTPRVGYEVALDVRALNGDGNVHLDKVWTVDRLPALNRNLPCEEDLKRWPHLRGIELPKLDGKTVEILLTFPRRIGCLSRDAEVVSSLMPYEPLWAGHFLAPLDKL